MQFFSVLNADGELARERDPNMTGDPNSAARWKGGSSSNHGAMVPVQGG